MVNDMKYLTAILGLLAFQMAWAADFTIPLGSACAISWAANPPVENVDAYDVSVGPVGGSESHRTEIAEGLTVTCAAAGIDTSAQGETWVLVRAHNEYGWSEPSVRMIVGVGHTPSPPRNTTVTQITVTVKVEMGGG